jgi:cytosine/adenosine deaminase-related metal-dependent hydrolase
VLGPGARGLDGGGLLIVAGRVERVLETPAAVRRAAVTRHHDLGPGTRVPGLVNAHAHLELGHLAGRLAPGQAFERWVRELVRLRAEATTDELARAARGGARRLLATGTTSVGDIDAYGGALRGLARPPLRLRQFRELLDAGEAARTAGALRRAARPLRESALRAEGIAPHAPFTASPALLAGAARLARERDVPVTIHWAETEAEGRWLRDGSGPLAALLGPSPRARGLP